jgi:hypothetical protein
MIAGQFIIFTGPLHLRSVPQRIIRLGPGLDHAGPRFGPEGTEETRRHCEHQANRARMNSFKRIWSAVTCYRFAPRG